MPDDVLALADRLWRGELGPGDYHPVSHLGGLAEICDGVAFVPSFATSRRSAPATAWCWSTPGARSWPPPCTTTSGGGTAAG